MNKNGIDRSNRSIQDFELELLIILDSICKQLGIKYFLIGGALIGAVRHQGFIPWDDDIDVGMLRVDYDKFIASANELVPDYVFLQTSETEINAPFNFAKLRNSTTTFIETPVKDFNINHGIYLDVFPIDYYPENKFKAALLDFSIKLATIRISSYFFHRNTRPKRLCKSALQFILKFKYKDLHSAIIARDYLYKKTSKSSLVRNYCGAWGKKEIYPLSWIENISYLKFEGHYFPVPSEYDKYLKHIYGDYMQYPPKEKQVTHHFTEIIDLNNPYTLYIKEKL